MKKIMSRKFLMSLVSAALVVLNDGLGLDLDSSTILGFASIVVSYVVTQGVIDLKTARKQ